MRPIIALLATVAVVAAVVRPSHSVLTGNADLRQAFNAGFAAIVASGAYDELRLRTFPELTNTTFESTCPFGSGDADGSSVEWSWPAAPVVGGTLEAVLDSRILTVGSPLDVCPFLCADADGNVLGFERDVIELVMLEFSAQYGVDVAVAFEPIALEDSFFDDVLAVLNAPASTVDFVAAQVSITPERETRAVFSCSYFDTRLGAVRTGLDPTLDLTATAVSLNAPGISVSFVRGTQAEDWVLINLPAAAHVPVTSLDALLDAATAGAAHVAVDDVFILAGAMANLTVRCEACTLYPTPIPGSSNDQYGFLFRDDASTAVGKTDRVLGLDPAVGIPLLILIACLLVAAVVLVAFVYARVVAPPAAVAKGDAATRRSTAAYVPVVPFENGGRVFGRGLAVVGRPQWTSSADFPPSTDSDECSTA